MLQEFWTTFYFFSLKSDLFRSHFTITLASLWFLLLAEPGEVASLAALLTTQYSQELVLVSPLVVHHWCRCSLLIDGRWENFCKPKVASFSVSFLASKPKAIKLECLSTDQLMWSPPVPSVVSIWTLRRCTPTPSETLARTAAVCSCCLVSECVQHTTDRAAGWVRLWISCLQSKKPSVLISPYMHWFLCKCMVLSQTVIVCF